MKPLFASIAMAVLILSALPPPASAAPAQMTAKQKACKAQAVSQVRRTMGKAAQANNAAAKAKGMGYYKQCMAG